MVRAHAYKHLLFGDLANLKQTFCQQLNVLSVQVWKTVLEVDTPWTSSSFVFERSAVGYGLIHLTWLQKISALANFAGYGNISLFAQIVGDRVPGGGHASWRSWFIFSRFSSGRAERQGLWGQGAWR